MTDTPKRRPARKRELTPAAIREAMKEAFQLLTPKQLAATLSVSPSTITKWRRRGMPCVFIGTRTAGKGSRPRYDLVAVRGWMSKTFPQA